MERYFRTLNPFQATCEQLINAYTLCEWVIEKRTGNRIGKENLELVTVDDFEKQILSVKDSGFWWEIILRANVDPVESCCNKNRLNDLTDTLFTLLANKRKCHTRGDIFLCVKYKLQQTHIQLFPCERYAQLL